MKPLQRRLWIGALLVTAGLAASAQMPGPNPGGPGAPNRPMMGKGMGQGDPATMQARRADRHKARLDQLKTRLQLTANQESAWTTFATAMQPPAPLVADRAQFRAEMEKLTTPQRIDKMQALKAQRDAQMTQRADAVKAFYATLNPAQQKVFDLESLRHGRRGPGGAKGMGPGMGMDYGMGWGGGHFRR